MAIGVGRIARAAIHAATMRIPIRDRLDDVEAEGLTVVEIEIDFFACQLLEHTPTCIGHPEEGRAVGIFYPVAVFRHLKRAMLGVQSNETPIAARMLFFMVVLFCAG